MPANHRAITHKSRLLIYFRIAGALRKKHPCLLRLPERLYKVRLHPHSVLFAQIPEIIQELAGTCRCKPRCEYRLCIPVAAVFFKKGFCLADRLLRILCEICRSAAVHIDLADKSLYARFVHPLDQI